MNRFGQKKQQIKLPILCLMIVIAIFVGTGVITSVSKVASNKTTQKVKATTVSSKQKNDTDITKLLYNYNFVGTALVVKNNKIIYFQGKGYSNYSSKWTNNTESLYQINSIQKSMTATLLMKLVQQKKVHLSDRLSKYYPTIPGSDEITLADMLQMKSGLSINTAPTKDKNDRAVIQYYVDNVKFNLSEMGEWRYSEVNYNLLAGIIGKASKMSYEKYFDQELVKPLGLKNTGFVYNSFSKLKFTTIGYANQRSDSLAINYQIPQVQKLGESHSGLGTGNIYMTAADLFKVESAINQGKIISKRNVRTIRTHTENSSYGGGVYNGKNSVFGRGGGYGYESYFRMDKSGNNGVVLLSNYYHKNGPIEYVGNKLFNQVMK